MKQEEISNHRNCHRARAPHRSGNSHVLFLPVLPCSRRATASIGKSEITFGGEYVQLGDLPLPDLDDGIASEALSTEETTTTQADNATGDGEALVSSNADSPLAAPSQDGGDVARRQAELRKEKANIDNRTSSAFNRGGDGQGQSGSPDGNASFGALQGTPGHNLGENYHLQVQRPTCPKSGTLRISIVVRRDGTVKKHATSAGQAKLLPMPPSGNNSKTSRKSFVSPCQGMLRLKNEAQSHGQSNSPFHWLLKDKQIHLHIFHYSRSK